MLAARRPFCSWNGATSGRTAAPLGEDKIDASAAARLAFPVQRMRAELVMHPTQIGVECGGGACCILRVSGFRQGLSARSIGVIIEWIDIGNVSARMAVQRQDGFTAPAGGQDKLQPVGFVRGDGCTQSVTRLLILGLAVFPTGECPGVLCRR